MKSLTSISLAVVVACSFAGHATPQPQQSEIDSADRLFQSGKFAEAGKLSSNIVAQNLKDHSATLQLGRIALLSNRLDEAQKWLEKAKALPPDDTDARVMLAEVGLKVVLPDKPDPELERFVAEWHPAGAGEAAGKAEA